jgi:hypothetical protein
MTWEICDRNVTEELGSVWGANKVLGQGVSEALQIQGFS